MDPASTVGTQVLQALLPVIGTLIGTLTSYLLYYLIGLIKNKQLQEEARKAVAYAEQQLEGNPEKLAYVRNFLRARAGKYLTDQDIDHLIESAVAALPPTNASGQQ